MKLWNVVALLGLLHRVVQVLVAYPESPLLPLVGDNAVLKVEPVDGGGDIPLRIIGKCLQGVAHEERNKPFLAPGSAEGKTAPVVAAQGLAFKGVLAHTYPPPPPDFWPRLAGGKS